MAPELIRRTRQLLLNLKLAQVYGLSATGFFTGLQDQEHTEDGQSSATYSKRLPTLVAQPVTITLPLVSKI
jgi:hypothetical protein